MYIYIEGLYRDYIGWLQGLQYTPKHMFIVGGCKYSNGADLGSHGFLCEYLGSTLSTLKVHEYTGILWCFKSRV